MLHQLLEELVKKLMLKCLVSLSLQTFCLLYLCLLALLKLLAACLGFTSLLLWSSWYWDVPELCIVKGSSLLWHGVVQQRSPRTSGPNRGALTCPGVTSPLPSCVGCSTCVFSQEVGAFHFGQAPLMLIWEVQHKAKIIKCLILFCSFLSCTQEDLEWEEAAHWRMVPAFLN